MTNDGFWAKDNDLMALLLTLLLLLLFRLCQIRVATKSKEMIIMMVAQSAAHKKESRTGLFTVARLDGRPNFWSN